MSEYGKAPDVKVGRLTGEQYLENFRDIHPPLGDREAIIEAERCYFCYDAPCVTACPTSIDIPQFIREISTGNPNGAAATIYSQNILGGMCARVCPTETLCEQACVREESEGKPVKIGLLQRSATDHFMETREGTSFTRAPETGKRVAIVGAGPAGLSCAHRLATYGHDITLYDAKSKAGGLNEYGIAAYKATNNFAQKEVEWLLSIGGITFENGCRLGTDFSLETLVEDYDAVFLAVGHSGVNAVKAAGEELKNLHNAVSYIHDLRQSEDLSKLPVGGNVVVIGGGMTAVDIAVQSKLLGAQNVTMVYRRGPEHIGASKYEQDLALLNGVAIRFWSKPIAFQGHGEHLKSVDLETTRLNENGELEGTGEVEAIAADVLFRAVGQHFVPGELEGAIELEAGRIKVDETYATSINKVWAGGDCVGVSDDLTVSAVEDGKQAAEAIHTTISA
ncbi:NAD(P)-dependent oxidoreductase [Flexibacterium corallicola]|uniref:NAD(P)-dependent oxidoreductase n=1 Tax=Flexibacterium corallicola TaxID=3037259 RepID=UPI00286EF9E8|nr:NAD(P)-dependent oxidoreductase [Pseudovibrio sp. M1P-2-3]